jgi:non-ribosomal peptide synthetase component E (peptide arylation enzyme)
MARYKVPTVRLIAALPLAPTGKVDKSALGKLALENMPENLA